MKTIEDNGSGLSLLTIIYCELLASNIINARELGPKGYLTLMSRLSFSDMYDNLELKESFSKKMDQYSLYNGKRSLFKSPYPLIYGDDLMTAVDPKITKCTKNVVRIIRAATLSDFIESIKTPPEKYIKENKEILSTTF